MSKPPRGIDPPEKQSAVGRRKTPHERHAKPDGIILKIMKYEQSYT